MKSRKFSILFISIITSIIMAFSSTTIVSAVEINKISNASGASITANESVFDSAYTLTVTENTTPSDMQNVSALIYENEQAYQKVVMGLNVVVSNGAEEISSNLGGEALFEIPTTLPNSSPVQIAYVNANYGVEFHNATVSDGVVKFNASHLGEFWVLLDMSSSLTPIEVFERSKILTLNLQSEGGFVYKDNYQKYLNVTAPGLKVAKSFSEEETQLNKSAFNDLLRLYKQASEVVLDTLYNKNDYSVTANGIYAINELKASAVTEINSATNIDEVDLAVAYFNEKLLEGGFSKKRSSIELTEGIVAKVTAYKLGEDGTSFEELLAFSDDTTLSLNDVKDGILVKNTNLALLDNEEVIANGGVYKYLNIQAIENGIVNQNEYDKIEVVISLESLGIALENGEVLQVAKYLRNRQVEIIPVTVVDGSLTFEISTFGDYAIVKQGYALENASAFMAFIESYGIICAIVLGAVLIIIIIIAISKSKKKRREKREFKEFKKSKKQAKKDAKKKKQSNGAVNTRKR